MQSGQKKPLFLEPEDRLRHLYIVGQTGTGKSTLLRNLATQDIQAGRGCTIIDPHGMLAEDLLDLIPPERQDDVIYIDPGDPTHSVGWNVLRAKNQKPALITEAIVTTLKNIWIKSWGDRMNQILRNSVHALVESEKGTLLSVQNLLTSPRYRTWVLSHVKDPVVLHFWNVIYPGWDERYRRDGNAAVEVRIGELASIPEMRDILGQLSSSFDIGEVMEQRKILIVNLEKKYLGKTGASLLGALFVSAFAIGSFSRPASKKGEGPVPHHLYIDELGSVSTEVFELIVSEGRKFGLALTVSHQYTDQLSDRTKSAIFGNTGSLVTFRIGPESAAELAEQFAPFPAETLVDLDSFRAYSRPLIDGKPYQPMFTYFRKDLGDYYGLGQRMAARSQYRFGRDREDVAEKIEQHFSYWRDIDKRDARVAKKRGVKKAAERKRGVQKVVERRNASGEIVVSFDRSQESKS